jgi:hypothetical protein
LEQLITLKQKLQGGNEGALVALKNFVSLEAKQSKKRSICFVFACSCGNKEPIFFVLFRFKFSASLCFPSYLFGSILLQNENLF